MSRRSEYLAWLKTSTGVVFTDAPRVLTPAEMSVFQGLPHGQAVKLYRQMTRASLRAATVFANRLPGALELEPARAYIDVPPPWEWAANEGKQL